MSGYKSRKDALDDFWDISALVPRKKNSFVGPDSIDTVEITSVASNPPVLKEADSTIITRVIPPRGGTVIAKRPLLDEIECYYPTNSLIHSVKILKYKTTYAYYATFLKNAIEYVDVKGESADFVPFFSYVPQYDQMTEQQLKYYFWFRQNVQNATFIKTDFGYLFLYIFELLNLGNRLDIKKSQYILMSLWNEYNSDFPAISAKLADWICDFSLLHHLSPPMNISSNIIKKAISLKEFYISIPQDDTKECAKILLRYCSSYDYRTSKFYTNLNRDLFDRYIIEALMIAIDYYSTDGKILSGYDTGDSIVARDVYAGAVCTAEQKYRIEVSYCSFSRSNELRFLVGDIVKYSENKLRSHLGIKSKMTVYSVTAELGGLIDKYFASHLSAVRRSKKTVIRQDYEKLYDIPKKPLSLSDAIRIEDSSWETTKELIAAFDDMDGTIEIPQFENKTKEVYSVNTEKNDAYDVWGIYRSPIIKLINGEAYAISDFASEHGKLPDAVVDCINEIAFDTFGDLLIEDDGMGNYTVVEDYIEEFKQGE